MHCVGSSSSLWVPDGQRDLNDCTTQFIIKYKMEKTMPKINIDFKNELSSFVTIFSFKAMDSTSTLINLFYIIDV